MKLVTTPDHVVACIMATREEYQEEWLLNTAAGGITLEYNEYSWYWISPTGAAYLFVLPQIGKKEAEPPGGPANMSACPCRKYPTSCEKVQAKVKEDTRWGWLGAIYKACGSCPIGPVNWEMETS